MNNELGLLVNDISQNELNEFMNNTNVNFEIYKKINKVKNDYSWIDKIEEAIPYLDNIIRNPKRFIISEEDIIPIEKTKHITEETIKHLATHTNLIQSVDENGDVKPIKLLNVFREETINLYENRFIYSLIKNLDFFLGNQIMQDKEKSVNSEERSLKYTANTLYQNNNINIELNLSSKLINENEESLDKVKEREQRIKAIQEVLQGFMASSFMKAMANATMVKSPIRKTNVILKEQNFVKALELWEFLELYQIENPTNNINETINLTNDSFKEDFGYTYYLNYGILNEIVTKTGNKVIENASNLPDSVYEYVKRFDVNEEEFKKLIEKRILDGINYKKEQKRKVRSCYSKFINNHNDMIKKATLLIQ